MGLIGRLDHYFKNTVNDIERTKADAMRKLKYLLIVLLLVIIPPVTNAQDGSKESTVGEFMRSDQRSYVVIAVMLTILTGLILYMVRLDRKISKLEKENRP
jgi:hypothetical protein